MSASSSINVAQAQDAPAKAIWGKTMSNNTTWKTTLLEGTQSAEDASNACHSSAASAVGRSCSCCWFGMHIPCTNSALTHTMQQQWQHCLALLPTVCPLCSTSCICSWYAAISVSQNGQEGLCLSKSAFCCPADAFQVGPATSTLLCRRGTGMLIVGTATCQAVHGAC